ncbi:MAG: UDP-glucose 4-epimerase GalE, partial [Candidatus Zophobacter franzmannii]|nr:UDP-glucose 4-epimerase GalE [Candidatus Zophobacter franzmannii]
VTIFDNLTNSKLEVLSRIEKITGVKPAFELIDLRNITALRASFDIYKFDAVIHFAGSKSVEESVNNPLDTYENNLLSTLNLLNVMKRFDVKQLIFSSSATVYSQAKQFPIPETSPLGTSCPYGESKLMIENILNDLYKSDNSWNIRMLRYFNPVGAHQSGLIGENPTGAPSNLFPLITGYISGKYKQFKVFGSDYDTKDGTCIRDYIHVVDLAKGHLKTLSHLKNSTGLDIFNLGTGDGFSVLEVIKAFSKVIDKDIPYQVSERRDGDIPVSYADATKAKKILDWNATLTLEDMCRDAWNWQKQNNK